MSKPNENAHEHGDGRTNLPIGFIGLGVMGTPMAGHLARAGHALVVYDIEAHKARGLAAAHANVSVADTPRTVAAGCGIVFTMLPSGEYVREAALGANGLIEGFEGGELLVDTSSSEPEFTRETAAALASKQVAMVDAPVSGAEWGAKSAELVFMVGGEADSVARTRPLLDVMGKQIFHLGPVGSGHAMKSINNLITAMTLLATSEGLALGTKLGLDPNVMTDVLNVATGMSWITQTHIKQRVTSRTFDDPFKLELMVKDIRIALELAESESMELPFCALGQRLWRSAEEAARRRADDAAGGNTDDSAGRGASVSELVRWVEQQAGVEIRSTER